MSLEATSLAIQQVLGELNDAQADAEVWRVVAHEAVHALAQATRERDTARAAAAALRDELRRYTGALVGRSARAA